MFDEIKFIILGALNVHHEIFNANPGPEISELRHSRGSNPGDWGLNNEHIGCQLNYQINQNENKI